MAAERHGAAARAELDQALARLRTSLDALVGEDSRRLRAALTIEDPAEVIEALAALDPLSWDLADAIVNVEERGLELTRALIADTVKRSIEERARR